MHKTKKSWLIATSSAFVFSALIFATHCLAQPAADAPAYADENTTAPTPIKLREVQGSVVGLGGDAMPHTSVALFNEQGHTLVAAMMTDKEGKFRFDKVDKGLYRIVVHSQGLCTANVPIVFEGSLLAHRKLVVTMQAKDIDTCSYGMGK
jgi:hypothetical protein